MSRTLALLLAALSGLAALSYELVWYRAFSLAGSGSAAVFGLLLAFYLLGLANGASRSRAFCHDAALDRPRTLRALRTTLLSAAVVSLFVVPATARLATVVRWVAGYPLVALAATLSGATLPLLAHCSVDADEDAGRHVSRLYLANIAGSVVGTLGTGYVLFEVLSLRTLSLLLFSLGALAWLLAARGVGKRELAGGLAVLAAATALWWPAYQGVFERLFWQSDYGPTHRFVRVVENRHGVLTVDADGRLYGSGVYDGMFNTSLTDDRNGVERAYGIAALHPRPARVLMVGLATGSWAQIVAHLPGVQSLTVVEIDPGYVPLIAERPVVSSLLQNPVFHLVLDDGRRWLLRNDAERFDVIVMNTTWHWRAHATNLLSREFLGLARAHLNPGGVVIYNATGSRDALRTSLDVFAHTMRMYNCAVASDAPLRFDPDRWREALTATRIDGRPAFDAAIPAESAALARWLRWLETLDRDPALVGLPTGLESEASLRRSLEGAQVITDDNMLTEWQRLFLPTTR